MNVFPHQAAAYSELLKRAQTYYAGHWRNLAIHTRWHSMLIGPTGGGKTALASMLAAATGASLLKINLASWMPAGAHNRACLETLTVLVEHVSTHNRSLLFLDESEKLHHDTSWTSSQIAEIYEILDGRWPAGTRAGEGTSLHVDEGGMLTLSQSISLTEKLRSSVFILAAATFQNHYNTTTSIGFSSTESLPAPENPKPEFLSRGMPKELLNRFHTGLIFLPQLNSAQYLAIAEEAERSLPSWLQPAFREAARLRIHQAISMRSGCRFVEEALADALQSTKAPDCNPSEPEILDW